MLNCPHTIKIILFPINADKLDCFVNKIKFSWYFKGSRPLCTCQYWCRCLEGLRDGSDLSLGMGQHWDQVDQDWPELAELSVGRTGALHERSPYWGLHAPAPANRWRNNSFHSGKNCTNLFGEIKMLDLYPFCPINRIFFKPYLSFQRWIKSQTQFQSSVIFFANILDPLCLECI